MSELKKRDQPLLRRLKPNQEPPFEEIHIEDYEGAFDEALSEAYADVDAIIQSKDKPSFINTVEKLERAGSVLDSLSTLFFNLNSACTSPEMQRIAQVISPKLTEFSMYISLNEALFERVKSVRESAPNLTVEEQTLLDNTWRMFERGGANLDTEKRARFKEVNSELSKLSLKFSENVLADTNSFYLHITNDTQLSGLPEGIIESAAMEAKERSLDGWVFTLHAPSFVPFMKYADNRELRKELFMARATIGNQDNEYNNCDVISKIVTLRLEKANLLGFNTYADFALKYRMAETPQRVNEFLDKLFDASHPFAIKDMEQVVSYAKESGFDGKFEKWDWAYYSNKLKQAKYDLSDDELRPYFSLDHVYKAVFGLATKLYGITFNEVHDVQLYHKDVKSFRVYDKGGEYLAMLYIDFFPRSNKEGGAWMTEYRSQYQEDGVDYRPIISLVTNFTKPTSTTPALLTFDEVTTLLHEFGHALHGIFSKCVYASISGTNVQRDFVELPSQLMENWAYEQDWLDSWAKHYITGEKIPSELLAKIKKSAKYQAGYQCDRQLSFGLIDMAWHSITEPFIGSVPEFEKHVMSRVELMPAVSGACFCTNFGHIFGGGYAAGYYSYKWAEVLDADAFSLFKAHDIFNREIADSFRQNILERGGSEPAMILYRRFRGCEPSINALLERDGIK